MNPFRGELKNQGEAFHTTEHRHHINADQVESYTNALLRESQEKKPIIISAGYMPKPPQKIKHEIRVKVDIHNELHEQLMGWDQDTQALLESVRRGLIKENPPTTAVVAMRQQDKRKLLSELRESNDSLPESLRSKKTKEHPAP